MDGIVMRDLLRFLGGILLVAAGAGSGFAVWRHRYTVWRQMHTLARLFDYLQGLLGYQALSGEELLRRAAIYPEFSQMGIEDGCTLEDLPLPAALSPALRQEIAQGLAQVALEPRAGACATLQRLHTLCEAAAAKQQEQVELARRLWPRLGVCCGILLVILLW